MKYLNFTIKKYKGINNDLIVDISTKSIIPIIGVNESGKTSILEAILAFDLYNDSTNKGNHLNDTENFYNPTDSDPAVVRAYIEISKREIDSIIKKLVHENEKELNDDDKKTLTDIPEKFNVNKDFWIERIIPTKAYSSNLDLNEKIDILFCNGVLVTLPYIHYFDDFRDEITEFIDIPESKDEKNQSKWIPYFQELFSGVDSNFSIYDLRLKSSNVRDSIVREAQKLLQEKLAKHWNNFSVLDSAPLEIELKYHANHKLEVKINEKIIVNGKEKERFFSIKDRSKGFFWYFNFIMKLEFNPQKRYDNDLDTIYLLDEPGSYLHATAQKRLCERLKTISKKNKVIYCTHSPYLLNPEEIPVNNIMLASKRSEGDILLDSLHNTKLDRKNAAFQPILHALEVIPAILDYDRDNIVLTEGIYDYYLFELLKSNVNLNFFPCDGANSIKFHISYMIFLGKKYTAIWDKDQEGINAYNSARKGFGDLESQKWGHYFKGKSRKVILQSLIEGYDVKYIKESLELPANTKFERVIINLYNSPRKLEIIKNISKQTKDNFLKIENVITERLNNDVQ